MSPESINVLSVKVGTRYTVQYVNKLKNSLDRHLNIPLKFYCLTDDPRGLLEDIEPITRFQPLEGWWNKLYLFSPVMPAVGRLLYFDLDQVILKDITPIVEKMLKHPFSCYADHIEWQGVKLGTAMMSFEPSGYYYDIWETFWETKDTAMQTVGGDQVWLEPYISAPYYVNEDFPGAIQSYKFDVLPNGGKPDDKAILINFHGRPKPHEVSGIPWIKQHWQ